MTALTMISVAGAMVFASGESTTALITGRLLLGLGMACNLMGPLKLITAWFSPRYFATLSTIFFSVGTAGNIAAATPLVWLTEWFGWRTTFHLLAFVNLAAAIAFFIIARDRPAGKRGISPPTAAAANFSDALSGIFKLFARRDYWLISIGTFFRYGIYASIQALWAAPFLMVSLNLSQVMAGNLLLVISIGLIVGGPLSGWLSDTIVHSRKSVIIVGMGVMAAVLITLAVIPDETWLVVLFVLFFIFGCSSGAGQIMYTHIKERMPLEHAGAAMTGINFFTMTGVACFLHGLGWAIKEAYPQQTLAPEAFRLAFFLFGGCLVVTSVLYGWTADSLKSK